MPRLSFRGAQRGGICCFLAGAVRLASAQTPAPATALAAIRESDLRRDLYVFAGDTMRGREAGTIDEPRAAAWLADQLQHIGVKPFGEFGTWFQWWTMHRTRLSATGTVRVGEHTLSLWSDITPTNTVAADIIAPLQFIADWRDTTVSVRGKVAVARIVAPPAASVRTTTNTYEHNYARAAIALEGRALFERGASAVILIPDSIAAAGFNAVATTTARGTYDVPGGRPRFVRPGIPVPAPITIPILLVRFGPDQAHQMPDDGTPVELHLHLESFDVPSVNVVGVVRGTDPKLRDEYVLFSSHIDHDGVRYAVNGDSIWNGADDNGSTTVSLMAIARAFVAHPGKRSAIFVFHGAEERGLLGSRWFAAHPMVPLAQIAAVLNGDMTGRNSPDTAALLGSQPPHRNSVELVRMALDANRAVGKFVIDSSWDRPDHPEGFYFRSDHAPYAALKVPSVYFTSMLHSDYHTPRDEPSRIDYAKLTRMSKWMYLTGWYAANAPRRPALDAGFELH
jgi:hypothetical protein